MILVAEDDVLVRFTAETLRDEGYVVLEASDAAEALALIGTGHRFDLVLSDIRMPGEMVPADPDDRTREADGGGGMAEPDQESDCVLVVDGDVLVRHAIADYLRNCGYVVIEASSTDEAAIVLGETSLAMAALLCDAEAPGSLNPFS